LIEDASDTIEYTPLSVGVIFARIAYPRVLRLSIDEVLALPLSLIQNYVMQFRSGSGHGSSTIQGRLTT
jgi:hypothetical protein